MQQKIMPINSMTGNLHIESLEFIPLANKGEYKLKALTVYENSLITGERLANTFFEDGNLLAGCIKVILFSPTQAGKTNVTAVASNILVQRHLQGGYKPMDIDCYYLNNLPNNKLLEQNVNDFYLTGINEMCTFSSGHTNNYKKLMSALDIKDKNRPQIVIIDESHWGNKKGSQFDKLIPVFERFKYVQLIYVSATPYAKFSKNHLEFKNTKNSRYGIVHHSPGEGYVSLKNLVDKGNIQNVEPIVDIRTAKDELNGLGKKGDLYLTDFLVEILRRYFNNFTSNKGNLVIRSTGKNANTIPSLIELYLKSLDKPTHYTFEDISATGSNDKLDKFNLINIVPSYPRILLIRGNGRAGIRIENKDAISIFVESTTDQNDSVAQAGAGRFTGYGPHPKTDIYTNLKAVTTVCEFTEIIAGKTGEEISQNGRIPSCAHVKPANQTQEQYKISFRGMSIETRQWLDTEKKEFDLLQKSILAEVQIRFIVHSSNDRKRFYKDFSGFINSSIQIHNNYIISTCLPVVRRDTKTEYGYYSEYAYLDGPSENPEYAKLYNATMNHLISSGVKSTDGLVLDLNKHYIMYVSQEKVPPLAILNPITKDNLSKNIAENI